MVFHGFPKPHETDNDYVKEHLFYFKALFLLPTLRDNSLYNFPCTTFVKI